MSDAPVSPRNLYEATQSDGGQPTTGTVLTVDPLRQVATVLDAKNSLHEEIPTMEAAGPDGEGWFGTPMPGHRATISHELGFTAIHHLVPGPTYFKETNGPETDEYTQEINTWLALTGTPKLYRVVEGTKKNFRSHRPSDLVAGDLGFRTAEGASVFALRGGVAGLKVSDLCQILLNQVDDILKLVSRNMDVFSDWGSLQFINKSGKTVMQMKGNALAKNTYGDKHQFVLTVGDGENFLDLQVLDKACEEPVFSVKVDQKGNQHVFLAKDQMIEINGLQAIGVTKSQKVIVGKDQEIEVDGKHKLTAGTSSTVKSPAVHLGDEGGQKAPMGEDLVDYLKKLETFWMQQAIITTPAGATIPGATLSTPYPSVPDLLSATVDYIK